MLFVIISSIILLIIGYKYIGAFLEKFFKIDPKAQTPATKLQDNVDFVPTSPYILFGHHFSSIAGAGPIVGPIIAGFAFGWGPTWLWVLFASIFIGGIYDYASIVASIRHSGKSLAQICKIYLGKAYTPFLIFLYLASVYVIIVFLDLTASSFAPVQESLRADGGAVATASICILVLAVIMGKIAPKLPWVVWVFVPLVFGSVWLGFEFPIMPDAIESIFAMNAKVFYLIVLLIYCFFASIMPVSFLLQPRDFLSSFLLIACLLIGFFGIIVSSISGSAHIEYPFLVSLHSDSLGWIFPGLFIAVACGAVSGFHSIISTGTTSKQIRNEKDILPIGYGGMLTEAFLAVIALACVMVCVSNKGLTPNQAFAEGLGFFAKSLHIPQNVATVFGLFAINAFLLTTLDTITRLGRMILQEIFGSKAKSISFRMLATLITLILPALGVFLEPNAWKTIWPIFGATNQLVGALTLLVIYMWLRKSDKKPKFIFYSMIFMFACSLTELSKKFIFVSSDGISFISVVSILIFLVALSIGIIFILELIQLKKKNLIEKN